jgi:hypothetical protein
MYRAIAIITLMMLCPLLKAQEHEKGSKNGQPFIQVLYHQGVQWNRTMYLEELLSDGFRGVEARIGFQTNGSEIWQQYNHYPKYGLGINFADQILSKRDTVLGNPFSIFAFYNAPFARFGRFSLNTNISVGLSYISLVYNPVSNPYNDIVASHINLYFNFKLNLAVKLSERLDLNTGYGVTHYSNGNIQEPQKGLNNWGWNVGASYFFGGSDKPYKRTEYIYTEPPEFKSYEELQFMLSVGITEWQPDDWEEGIYYFASSLTADYAFKYSVRSAMTLGMDFMYDGQIEQAILGIAPEDVTEFQKIYIGGHLGYQFTIDKLTLLFNFGTYFVQSTYDRGFFFGRAGGRIRLTDHLAVHIAIKTKNGVRSDWIEWGLAYSIKTR